MTGPIGSPVEREAVERCEQPGDEKFWTVHVHGPDDVILFDTEDGAESYVAAIEDLTKPGGPLHPASSFDPAFSAHVIAPSRPVVSGSAREDESIRGTAVVTPVRDGDPGDDEAVSVYDEIRAERERAHAKHGETSMEAWAPDSPTRLAILMEEVGEVAREFNDARHDGLRVDQARLRAELIQTAAMAAAWAHALPRVVRDV